MGGKSVKRSWTAEEIEKKIAAIEKREKKRKGLVDKIA